MTPAHLGQLARRVSNPLIFALAVLTTGCGLLWVARMNLETANRQLLRSSQSARDASERLQALQQDEIRIRQGATHFAKLTTMNIIGPEHRLDWVRAVSDSAKQLRLPAPTYNIAPQIQLDAVKNGADFGLMSSPMKLELQLLHEHDLLDFLDTLASVPNALMSQRECRLERLSNDATERLYTLRARCELDWITLRSGNS